MNLEFNIRNWETNSLRGAYISVFNDDFVISGAITPAIEDGAFTDYYKMYVDIFQTVDRVTSPIGEWEHQYESIDLAIGDFKEFGIDYFKVMGEQNAAGTI